MRVYLTESQIITILNNLTRLDDVNVEAFDDWKRDKVNDRKCERIRKRLHEVVYKHKKKSTKK